VHIDNIEEYPAAYLLYPVMLTAKTAAKLRQYVERGGVLISEGVPGYFGDGAHAGATQPNLGLADVFGAAEADVDFTPDLLENLTMRLGDRALGGRFFKQTYRPTGGKAAGWYSDGSVAAVENRFGKGRTLLIGTFPGAAYFRKPSGEARAVFQSLLPRKQRVTASNAAIVARLHEGAGGSTLWVINPTPQVQSVTIAVDGARWQSAKDVWSKCRRGRQRQHHPAECSAERRCGAAVGRTPIGGGRTTKCDRPPHGDQAVVDLPESCARTSR